MRKGPFLAAVAAACAIAAVIPESEARAGEDIAPPAADETLIYLIREKRTLGAGIKFWVSLNDRTVARIKHKQHAILRGKSGRLTLSLSVPGAVAEAIALDDRPGETVYLKHRWGDPSILVIDEDEAMELLEQTKPVKPINDERPNEEELLALTNLARLDFELMQPAEARLEPDEDHAVITILRREEFPGLPFSVWSEAGFVGSLQMNEAIDVRVPAGEHFFYAAQTGSTVLKARVDAGQQYYAWLDVGKMRLNLRLKPIGPEQQAELREWLTLVQWVALDEQAMTPRVREREEIVRRHVLSVAERVRSGAVGFQELNPGHAMATGL